MNDDLLKNNAAEFILMNYWSAFVISDHQKKYSGEKCLDIYVASVD